MRLLNIHAQEFAEFHGESIPSFVITSHRWTANETSYKELRKKKYDKTSAGYKKIEGFIGFVKKDNEFLKHRDPEWPLSDWIWMDTCCIDQRSTQEVSESINSMFAWYSQAHECLAYLADVRPLSIGVERVMDDFRQSEWFLRGWTLQELLAPTCVIFLNQNWEVIGHKCAHCVSQSTCAGIGPLLNHRIAEITGIPEAVLGDYRQSESLTVLEKMSWMLNRRTTRIEDMAYSLLGIFDINMPLLYGEGPKAVLRLERKIQKEAHRSTSRSWSNEAFRNLPAPYRGSQAMFPTPLNLYTPSTSTTHVPGGMASCSPGKAGNTGIEAMEIDDAAAQSIYGTARSLDQSSATSTSQAESFLSTLGSAGVPLLPLFERVRELSKSSGPPTPSKSRVELPIVYECLQSECAQAGVKFSTRAALERHNTQSHEERNDWLKPVIFICDHCGYEAARKDIMARHKAEHLPRQKVDHHLAPPLPPAGPWPRSPGGNR